MTESLFDYTKLIQKDYVLETQTANLMEMVSELAQEYGYLYKKRGLQRWSWTCYRKADNIFTSRGNLYPFRR